MNILLIGGGGREHALAWRLAQSPSVDALWAAPGNPGVAQHATCVALDPADHAAVVDFARAEAIDLVVVGPEGPLVDGLADSLRDAGVAVFGPSAAAARLEGSKAFTKALCTEYGVPTARYEHCETLAGARAALDRFALPVVVKADGLAAGKGVVIAATRAEAEAALDALFAHAGAAVVIEAFLVGEEVSFFAISDGLTVVPFGSAQDHKRIGEGDTGPNTGGMGAYSPALALTPMLEARARAEIVEPTIAAMAARGTPFVGVLFAGLMLTADGPSLIEFNVRLGDPETQVLMPRVEGDLAALFMAAATGRLSEHSAPRFADVHALTVVIAAHGYPGTPATGGTVAIGPLPEGVTPFLAGVTDRGGGTLIASGGRVLAVTGVGSDLAHARALAYAGVAAVGFDGYHRRDIGWRAPPPA